MSLRLLALAPFVAAAVLPVQALADDAIPGKIIVARTVGNATVLYDASPVVAEIVKDKVPDAQANDRLERLALRVLAKEQALLSGASTVTVRVTYEKTGDISPVYGNATFTGIERYANLTMPIANVKSDTGKWHEAGTGSGPLPAGTTFEIVGTLPPRAG